MKRTFAAALFALLAATGAFVEAQTLPSPPPFVAPLPDALPLFASGLIALTAFAYRRKWGEVSA